MPQARSASRRGTIVGDADGKPTSRTRAARRPAQLGELAGGGIQRRRHGGGVPREDPAGIGEADAPPDPLDERHAEALFEALELLADRRLAVAESARPRR